MTDVCAAYFEALRARGHEQALEHATGTLQIDMVDGDKTSTWVIVVTKGDVDVTRETDDATSTLRGPKRLLGQVFTGEKNAMAAMLRGELSFEGDPQLLLLFQRTLPGPPRSTHPLAQTNAGGEQT
jgi:putative sterol carrier protein